MNIVDIIIVTICIVGFGIFGTLFLNTAAFSQLLDFFGRFSFADRVTDIWRSRILLKELQFAPDPNWFMVFSKEFKSNFHTSQYIKRRINFLKSFEFPTLTLDSRENTSDNLSIHIDDTLSHDNLIKYAKRLEDYQNLPIAVEHRKEQTIEILTGILLEQAPDAKKIILTARSLALREQLIGSSLKAFMAVICSSIKKDEIGSSQLKQYLDSCLRSLSTEESEQYSSSMKGDDFMPVSNQFNSSESDFNSTVWTFIEVGLATGFSYYVNDFDDIDLSSTHIPDVGIGSDNIGDHLTHVHDHHFDVDGAVTVSFPIISTVLELSKQITLLSEERTKLSTAIHNTLVNVGAKLAGATLGGAIGAAIGTAILPGIGTWIGGIIGSISGRCLGNSAAKEWRKSRFEDAKYDFEITKKRAKNAIDNEKVSHYEYVSTALKEGEKSFNESRQVAEVKLKDKELRSLLSKFMLFIKSDLILIKEWHSKFTQIKYPTKKLKKIAREIRKDIEKRERIIIDVEKSTTDDAYNKVSSIGDLLTSTTNSSLIQKRKLIHELYERNTETTFGLILWTFSIESLFYSTMEKVGDKVRLSRLEIIRLSKEWNTVLSGLKIRVEDLASQL